MEQQKQSFELIRLVAKHKKVFVWVTALSIVISVAVALILPNKYRAEVILYPVPNVSLSKALFNPESSAKDLLAFGDEDEADQMLQVLQSDQIRNEIAARHDLLAHYEIKPDDPHKLTKLYKEFKSNVSFERTRYMSVQIRVVDEDPIKAAAMANDITDLLDSTMNKMKKAIARPAFEIVKQEYQAQKDYVRSLHDSMAVLNGLGVQAYEAQVEVLSDKLGEAYLKNNQPAVQKIQQKLDVLAKYGGAYEGVMEELEFERERLSELKAQYEMAKVDAEQNVEHKFVVNAAAVPDKKYSPMRSLIVAGSLVSAWLFTIILLIIQQGLKQALDSKMS